MAMAIQPVIKLLNHLIRLPIGAELQTMLGVALETGLADDFSMMAFSFIPKSKAELMPVCGYAPSDCFWG